MKTADLVDHHPAAVRFCDLPFRRLGRRRQFSGPVQTLICHEDNALLVSELKKPGEGRVMVVDGGLSTRTALLGDVNACLVARNGWAGIIIAGAVRDSDEIDAMDIGVFCLSFTPLKSGKTGAGLVSVPLLIGGAPLAPGNWAWCDADGVLFSDGPLDADPVA